MTDRKAATGGTRKRATAARKVAAPASPAEKKIRGVSTAARRGKRPAGTVRRARVVEEPPESGSDSPGGATLVIVESPAKAKTIGKYLGRAYRVKATVGHIMDLPEKKLGIDVDNGFKPELVEIPGKEKTIAELKSAAKDSREVLIATDPDREGEAIA